MVGLSSWTSCCRVGDGDQRPLVPATTALTYISGVRMKTECDGVTSPKLRIRRVRIGPTLLS